MATIKVRGRGTVPMRPDEAILTFELVSIADAPAEAFAETSRRAAALDAVLDEQGIDRDARSTVGIVLHEHQEFDVGGEPRRAHRAATTVNVRLAELDAVPRLLESALERAEAYVRGPTWRLSDTSGASAEACRRAIMDASDSAAAYAGAIGLRVGNVQSVEDVTPPDAGPARGLVLHAVEAPPIYPGELVVSASVDMVFELEPM
jgi:uncharacterized protein